MATGGENILVVVRERSVAKPDAAVHWAPGVLRAPFRALGLIRRVGRDRVFRLRSQGLGLVLCAWA
jgi:hypothetical protein